MLFPDKDIITLTQWRWSRSPTLIRERFIREPKKKAPTNGTVIEEQNWV